MIDESRICAARKTFSRASVTRGNVKGAGRASFSQRGTSGLSLYTRCGFFLAYSYRSRHGVRNALNKVTARQVWDARYAEYNATFLRKRDARTRVRLIYAIFFPAVRRDFHVVPQSVVTLHDKTTSKKRRRQTQDASR